MSHETRVNLLHLLEDIGDSYAAPLEEVIITELIANALDSGASRIEFITDPAAGFIRIIDNGRGMRRAELKEYHNIAATAKIRGRGIGFAGIGAKLSLLVAERVITETRGPHGSRSATQWHLASPFRAPWKFIPFAGNISTPRGTAVTIFLNDRSQILFDADLVNRSIRKHFRPFFNQFLAEKLRRFIYRKGVEFWVNGVNVARLEDIPSAAAENFIVSFGRKDRRPVGFGYLERHKEPTDVVSPGLSVSTYGKVIKSGWEWIGLFPHSREAISGTVEIPGLAEILTTNKADFLNDAKSLKKYYRFRKAAQEAVRPVLRLWGEERSAEEEFLTQRPKPLEREIKEVLGFLLEDFPELTPLVHISRRPGTGKKDASASREEYLGGVSQAKEIQEKTADKIKSAAKESHSPEISREGGERGTRKEPGLKILFEEGAADESLARLIEDTVFINTGHPAWEKANHEGAADYHIITATAWALSSFLEEGRSSQAFVSRFLAFWGREKENFRLF